MDQTMEYNYLFNLTHPFVRGPLTNEVFGTLQLV